MEIDSSFKQRLKHRFIAAAQRTGQARAWRLRALIPAGVVTSLLIIIAVPLLNRPAPQTDAEFSQLESALVQFENTLRADVAQAQETSPAPENASTDEDQLTAYINQLSHIVLLLERLIERLETAGKDTNLAKTQFIEAKSKLAEAESRAKHPDTSITETKENLGDVAGILRTSVTSAKQAL